MTARALDILAAAGGRVGVARSTTTQTTTQPASAPAFLTRRDLAARWGVCWMTVRRMEKAGKLVPTMRFGSRAVYSQAQVEALEVAPSESSPPPPPGEVRIARAARDTGVSRHTLRRLYQAGFIKGHAPSHKTILLDLADLREFLAMSARPGFWTPERKARFKGKEAA